MKVLEDVLDRSNGVIDWWVENPAWGEVYRALVSGDEGIGTPHRPMNARLVACEVGVKVAPSRFGTTIVYRGPR